MQQLTTIQQIAVWVLPVLFAITVHEVAHGWVAYKFGDRTAYQLGRLTLNPIKHIDPIGTIAVPLILLLTKTGFIFGWAKPVPVISRNLKNPKRAMAYIAAAGPLSNLIMALGWAAVMKLGVLLYNNQIAVGEALFYMGDAGIIVNLILGILNIIPIPPLDGSRVVSSFLPARADMLYSRLEPFGFFILIGLLLIGAFQYLIWPPFVFCYQLIKNLFGL